jgi:sigma-B regulation protein RsbU (phosphoserine phosphatase)
MPDQTASGTIMKRADLSQNHTLARLTTMMRELEQSRTPHETINALQRGFAELGTFYASVILSTRGLPAGDFRVIRMQLQRQPIANVPGPLEAAPAQSGGVFAEIIRRPEPQLIAGVDWSSDPYFSQILCGYASVMALPLMGRHLPMNWLIMLKKSPEQFTIADMEEAAERVALGSALLENQVLVVELARANEHIDLEARKVGELQRELLPESLPRIAGLQIAACYEPSGRAGGDLYDFFPLDEASGDRSVEAHRWCCFIADTAGHGLPAAVIIAILQAVLRAHPPEIATPGSLLMYANRQLCSKRLSGFVTAFLGIYEPASRRLTYAAAGHPPPLLRRHSDGSIIALDQVGSYPLGIEKSENFKEAVVQFDRGDMIVLYTDGITEARGPDGELFELDRLTRVLREAGDRPADLIDRLMAAVRGHERGQSPKDDQTVVAARIL